MRATPGCWPSSPKRPAPSSNDGYARYDWQPGSSVFHAGEVGDALYVVRSGLVDVTTGDDDDRHLRTFGPGDIFGEQALLTGRPRSARAVAQTGVTLWRLDHTDFLYLMGSDPQLGAAVARTLSERLTATNRLGTGSPRGQSVVLATSPAVDAADLVAEFAAATATLLGQDPLVIACGPAEDWVGTSLPAGTTVSEPDGLAEAAVGPSARTTWSSCSAPRPSLPRCTAEPIG